MNQEKKKIEIYSYLIRILALTRVYSLTDKGRNVLDELILFWSSYENCVNGFIESYQQARVSK